MKPIVFFGTPAANRTVTTDYAVSLAVATAHLLSRGVVSFHAIVGGHDVGMQRDLIADKFLKSQATHLLMVDSDIGFPPELPFDLLSLNKSLIGALYPKRRFDMDRLEALIRDGCKATDALPRSYLFAVDVERQPVTFTENLARVRGVGGGFMLIAREVFERIDKKSLVQSYIPDGYDISIKQFFPWRIEHGKRIPEDWGFCRQWIAVGGEVFAYGGASMTHVSHFNHMASVMAAAGRK